LAPLDQRSGGDNQKMTAIVRYMLGMTMVLALTTAAMAADKAIIILDASGSMWGQIDSKPKLEIARESLRTVLQSMPADLELGFMAYGHREKGNCSDIELIVDGVPRPILAAEPRAGLRTVGGRRSRSRLGGLRQEDVGV
jgi:hypothetical protein